MKLLIPLLVVNTVIVARAVYLGLAEAEPTAYLGEHSIATWWSFCQLALACVFCFIAFKQSRNKAGSASVSWIIVTSGFFFLALDEVLQIHERLDHSMHYVLNIQESGFTDHLDEMIILVYGFAGAIILFAYRGDVLTRLRYPGLLAAGFAAFLMMVLFDFLSNGSVAGDLPQGLLGAFQMLEDSLKLYGEAFLVAAFALLHPDTASG